MKKVLLSLFAVIIVFAVLAGAGFAGYRVGYDQGSRVSGNDNLAPTDRGEMPRFNFGKDPDGEPGRDFERGFDRGFPRGDFRMMPHGRGVGIFSLFRLLTHLAIWALVIGLVYMLFTRSGWQLSVTRQAVQDPPATSETEAKPANPNSENE